MFLDRYAFSLLHNCLAHPLLGVFEFYHPAWLLWLHDWTARKAWPDLQLPSPPPAVPEAYDKSPPTPKRQDIVTISGPVETGKFLFKGLTVICGEGLYNTQVLVNGYPLPCTALHLDASVGQLPQVRLEFHPGVKLGNPTDLAPMPYSSPDDEDE